MSRQCPFLEFNRDGGIFSPTYRCVVSKEYVLTGSALYENYCNNYESNYKQCPHFGPRKENSSCYITSACTEARGLPDDCYELTILRNFRDNWLAKEPDGKAAIDEYYRIAPQIVNAIHDSPHSSEILSSLYDEMIVPCVRYIELGDNVKAYELYQKTTLALKEKYIVE